MGLTKILDYEMKCPVCGEKFTVTDYLYEVPFFDKIIISSGVCSNCGYKWRDVRLIEFGKPIRIKYRVDEPRDLNALIVKSASATVRILELDLELKPGYFAQGYITTVEGLLLDFYEKAKFLCSEDQSNPECVEKLKLIEKAMNVEFSYTVEITDPLGASKIVSEKAIVEEIDLTQGGNEY